MSTFINKRVQRHKHETEKQMEKYWLNNHDDTKLNKSQFSTFNRKFRVLKRTELTSRFNLINFFETG